MKRRDFLKFSTSTALAMGVGLYACAHKSEFKLAPVPDSKRLRIGIIGVGDRGNGILEVLRNVPEFKVVAICDIFDYRMDAAEKRIGNEVQRYKKYDQLLAHKPLDAVIIAVPLHLHHAIAMASLDCDLHIMCEKALAYSIQECQEIKIKAKGTNKLFQISYQYQLNPMFQTIRDLINNGYVGRITRIEALWDRNHNWRRKLPDASLVKGMDKSKLERIINWRMYQEYSGGLNAELGSHQFNMIDNLLGTHPIKVMGTGGVDYWQDGRDTFDNVHMLFDYPNGTKVGFHSGTTNKYEGFKLKIYGKKATVVSHNMSSAFIYPEDDSLDKNWKEEIDSVTGASIKIIDNDKKRNIKPVEKDMVYPSDNFMYNATWLLYKNFAAAINGEEELKLGIEDGYQSAIAVHMANKAVRQSEIVSWLPEYDV
ncbi:Gfo/Idh/MocA family oxidoreductase [Saccharicrinis sp. 156]|uniref:Gfo/Idh/MocA family oxidoreductase n=1 Tax=Saccharicrinis sp. 156 TaxID=3417574 RepID=UPI003D34FF80